MVKHCIVIIIECICIFLTGIWEYKITRRVHRGDYRQSAGLNISKREEAKNNRIETFKSNMGPFPLHQNKQCFILCTFKCIYQIQHLKNVIVKRAES